MAADLSITFPCIADIAFSATIMVPSTDMA